MKQVKNKVELFACGCSKLINEWNLCVMHERLIRETDIMAMKKAVEFAEYIKSSAKHGK